MELVYFLGRFHVLALHLPIGILIAVVALEWLSHTARFRHLAPAAPFLWALAALTAVGTAALGYMHFAEGGFDGPAAFRHRLFGTSVAIVTTAVWLLRTRFPQISARTQIATGVLVLALVTVTGHYGGNLTHGDTYLVERAPAFVRSLAGLAPARGKITDLAMANPFVDVVQPLFNARCLGCHNESKRRGGLSLASYASLKKGGKDGAVITSGDAAASDLYRRISLSPDHKDAMPAEGKTPLTPEQIEIVRWWIASGARADTTLAHAALTPHIRTLLSSALGLAGATAASSAGIASGPEVKADPRIVDALVQAGFQVRQRSRSDARLIVSGIGIRDIGDAQLKALAAAHEQIAELSLKQAGLRDADLTQLASLTNVTRLNLAGNHISDAGLPHLLRMSRLESLNLYGNEQVSDASVDVLQKLPALKHLYLWNTQVHEAQTHSLTQHNPELAIDLGDSGPSTTTQ